MTNSDALPPMPDDADIRMLRSAAYCEGLSYEYESLVYRASRAQPAPAATRTANDIDEAFGITAVSAHLMARKTALDPLPPLTEYVRECIRAYGDAREEADGTCTQLWHQAVLEVRKWGATIAALPQATTAQGDQP